MSQEHPPTEFPKNARNFADQLILTLEDGSEVEGWYDANIPTFYQRGTDPRIKGVKSWRYQKWTS